MKARLVTFWEHLRANFWFVPTLMVTGAVLLAFSLVTLDGALGKEALSGWAWFYTGGPDGARSLLSAVAGSVIGVAGTTFSITIAALALASSQFGPRLLRNFVRDRGNQVVLGTFIATFTYCLVVLRTIRGLDDVEFVPHIAVTVGVLLALASIGVLIYFIHHIAVTIQVDHIVESIGSELGAAIDRLYPEEVGYGADEFASQAAAHDGEAPDWLLQDARGVVARSGGYIQFIDTQKILALALKRDVIVQLPYRPGHYVVEGDDLAQVYPAARVDDDLVRALNDAVALGYQRTQQQDIEYAIDQLVEVAVRALSPGINDPFTALTCINQLGEALCRLAERELPGSRRYDQHGHLRVLTNPPTFPSLVNGALDQIRQYGSSSAAVLIRLLEMLTIVMRHTRTDAQRAALLRQAQMIRRASETHLSEPNDRADVTKRYERVLQVMHERNTRPVEVDAV